MFKRIQFIRFVPNEKLSFKLIDDDFESEPFNARANDLIDSYIDIIINEYHSRNLNVEKNLLIAFFKFIRNEFFEIDNMLLNVKNKLLGTDKEKYYHNLVKLVEKEYHLYSTLL